MQHQRIDGLFWQVCYYTTGGTFAQSNISPTLASASYNANNQQTAFGASTETYDLNGNLTTSTVNTQGQPLTIKDPLNNITTFAYELGDLIAVKDPLNRETKRMLDAAGRLRSLINSLGQKTIYTPDTLDRITLLTDAINGVTQFGYDPNSNLLTVTDAKSQQRVYTPNNMNRTTTREESLLNTETSGLNGSLTAVTVRYDEDMFGECGG